MMRLFTFCSHVLRTSLLVLFCGVSSGTASELLIGTSTTDITPNVSKIMLSAIHTHTAPVLEEEEGESSFLYQIPKEGVTQVKAYKAFADYWHPVRLTLREKFGKDR